MHVAPLGLVVVLGIHLNTCVVEPPSACLPACLLPLLQLPYTTIEVNPLTKGELRWSTYRKVPVVKLEDEVLVDSSAIISRLAAELRAAGGAASKSTSSSSSKGW